MLTRKHNSYEDLTEFVIAARQREADIKEGKIFPYEPRIVEEKDKPTDGRQGMKACSVLSFPTLSILQSGS